MQARSRSPRNSELPTVKEELRSGSPWRRELPITKEDRRHFRCASPNCWMRIHESADFGGYCCKKCYWVTSTSRRRSRGKNHGQLCSKEEAHHSALVAPPIPPKEPCDFCLAQRQQSSTSKAPRFECEETGRIFTTMREAIDSEEHAKASRNSKQSMENRVWKLPVTKAFHRRLRGKQSVPSGCASSFPQSLVVRHAPTV